jgi:hypothetical protein
MAEEKWAAVHQLIHQLSASAKGAFEADADSARDFIQENCQLAEGEELEQLSDAQVAVRALQCWNSMLERMHRFVGHDVEEENENEPANNEQEPMQED